MKSKLVILSLLVAAATTATAQTKEKYVSEKASDNIFLSLGVGANASMYKENGLELGKGIAPHITISVGKWITPTWGVRAQGGFWQDKVYTGWGVGGKINPNDASKGLAGDKEKYSLTTGRLRIDGLYNLTSAIMGYNPDRIFSLSAFLGPGLTFASPYTSMQASRNDANGTWSKTLDDKKMRTYINGSLGLLAKFEVSSALDIDIEARGELSPSYYGTLIPSSKTTGALYLTAGVTYTFGGKKFVTCGGKVDVSGVNDELNRYRQRLSQAEAELASTRDALSKKPQTTTQVVKEVKIAGPRAIFFKIGSARFDDYGKVNIDLAAKVMKENPNHKYKIIGYADKATGSASLNQTLSQKRAQAVYDALVAQGVSRDQLEIVAEGGTDNMFGKSMLNRVVILE
jgi:outer membrane protein OmpA-like peptidoglycan-associated protein